MYRSWTNRCVNKYGAQSHIPSEGRCKECNNDSDQPAAGNLWARVECVTVVILVGPRVAAAVRATCVLFIGGCKWSPWPWEVGRNKGGGVVGGTGSVKGKASVRDTQNVEDGNGRVLSAHRHGRRSG